MIQPSNDQRQSGELGCGVRKKISPARRNLLVLGFYILCASLLLIPIGFNLTGELIATRIPPDATTALWFFRWWPYAITHRLNPFVCYMLWGPFPKNLTWANGTPVLAILLWPITALFGAIATYNILAILAPALNAFFAYLLITELDIGSAGALAGGLIFGFSSYVMAQLLAHLCLAATWALPLLVWLAVLFFKQRISARRYALCAALALVFQFGISIEVFASTVIFGGLILVIAWLIAGAGESRVQCGRLIKLTVLALCACAVIVSPWLLAMLRASPHVGHSIFKPAEFSADLANFLIPTKLTALMGGTFLRYSHSFNGNITEQGSYLGLPLIAICGLYAWEFRRTRMARLLMIAAVIMFVMSLGPDLRWHGRVIIPIMPEALFLHVPLLLDALPVRFTLYLWLVVAIIAGIWVAKSKTPRGVRIALISVAILFICPDVFAGYWSSTPDNPKFFATGMYRRYIHRDENVMLFPFWITGRAMLWQEETNFYFRTTGGYIPLLPTHLLTDFPAFIALLQHRVPLVLARRVEKFFYRFHVDAVLMPHTALYKPMRAYMALLKCQPIHAGGMDLYNLPKRQSKFVPFDSLKLGLRYYTHPTEAPARKVYAATHGKDPVACAVLGFVLCRRHEYSQALAYLRQSLELYPYQPRAIEELASCYRHLGNENMVLTDLSRGLYLMPNSPSLYADMGRVRYQRHQYAIAAAAYRKALVYMPNNAVDRAGLAQALAAMGQWSEAQAQFSSALADAPSSLAVHYMFASALLRRGSDQAALEQLSFILRRNPDYRAARTLAARVLQQQGHLRQASKLLKAAEVGKRHRIIPRRKN
jgi:Tfp pilus assembly protein PilF